MKTSINNQKLERVKKQALIRAARDVAKLIPDIIRERTYQGEGLKGPLAPLSDSYKKIRERFSRKLSDKTSPGKSNLTATGQLMNSITSQVSGTMIKIFISDKTRRKFLAYKSNATNKQIRGYVENGGREFLGLKGAEWKLIYGFAKETITQEIKKAFK